jgi:hypothetical protein
MPVGQPIKSPKHRSRTGRAKGDHRTLKGAQEKEVVVPVKVQQDLNLLKGSKGDTGTSACLPVLDRGKRSFDIAGLLLGGLLGARKPLFVVDNEERCLRSRAISPKSQNPLKIAWIVADEAGSVLWRSRQVQFILAESWL